MGGGVGGVEGGGMSRRRKMGWEWEEERGDVGRSQADDG